MTKILVTGGAGFIGTNFVYHMVEKGHEVVVLDKLTYAGGQDNLEPLKDKVKLIVGDICNPQTVQKALVGIEQVVHFAAESHNTRSENDPDIFYRTNVEGTRVMLDESFKAQVTKFIHISTDEVYGSRENGYFKETDKVIGDSQATSAYSKSKSLADDLAMEMAKKYPIIVTRTTNNFGPWQFPEKALPRWITNLLLDKKIPLWGEGNQVRDWLYAPTNAGAIEFLMEHGKVGEAYNVAANHDPEITNKQAAQWLTEILGLDAKEYIDYIPDPRPDHDFRYALNIDKIKALGWNYSDEILAQFKQTVQWYQENRTWWEKRKAEAERIY